MTPKKQILKFIQQSYENNRQTDPAEKKVLQELFDGMSTGPARMIIEQDVGPQISEEYNIGTVENKGRYYIAKIVRPDGSPIQRLLIDKQTGNVQMVGR
jgi:hypothetical protein